MVNSKFLAVAAVIAGKAFAEGGEAYDPDWTPTTTSAWSESTPYDPEYCKGWDEEIECEDEDGNWVKKTQKIYNKGCPDYYDWTKPKPKPKNVWDPIKKTTTTAAYVWDPIKKTTTTAYDPWATWTTSSYDPWATWTTKKPGKPWGKDGKPWDPKDDEDEECEDWDVYEWDDGKPWWGKNKDGKPWYPKHKDGKPWYPKDKTVGDWEGYNEWEGYNDYDSDKSWWGKNKDGKPWQPKDKDGKPWYPKDVDGKPWDPKGSKPWDGKNWVTTKWENYEVDDGKKWGKKVVTITLTETYKTPCSTGWAEKTVVWYTTHCGCTETPVPKHPAYSTYTTECPEAWGVGKTVTVTVPYNTWKPVDPVTTWANVVDASSTWVTWAKPTTTYPDGGASWAAVTSTPVKATGAAPWSPVATYKGAASSSTVSKAMVAAAGAFAGLAFLL